MSAPSRKTTSPEGALIASARYLHLPVRNGAQKKFITLTVNGEAQRRFEIELAEEPSQADWWAHLDLSPWKGETFHLQAEEEPLDSRTLAGLEIGNDIKNAEILYQEPLRPQFHFSPRRGWLNDPNGLVYHAGIYHLFYQHNPYGLKWGNMHWGHAVSPDLVHWTELDIALYPDSRWMYSGSGMVDWQNVSGLGTEGHPPLLFFYTSEGTPTDQCLAWSLDNGLTLHKYAGNPLIKEIDKGDRDPKVVWDPASKLWILVLYVGKEAPGLDSYGHPNRRHTIQFFNSSNLLDWTHLSETEGYYECPDFFELPLDGNPRHKKWLLTGADSTYQVGTFDGKSFHPETPILQGATGTCFYAAQTYSDIPAGDGRRIQIGWLRADSPGMPFNQCMSLPMSLDLVSTTEGPRLTWTPAQELETLRQSPSCQIDLPELAPGTSDPLAGMCFDAAELKLEIHPGSAKTAKIGLHGIPLTIDFENRQVRSGDLQATLHSQNGEPVSLRIFQDRTTIEIFLDGGRGYMPFPAVAKSGDLGYSLTVTGGTSGPVHGELYELQSAWPLNISLNRN